ncbi:pilus (MSHA type) biogenesis protein MshL [Campylobacter sp. RM16192]|uniref:pilus (MSHA type) biogenesis protein MshL n=1 Tax=Campylobacter sp. RM16192 TaxID=1660080 RepID=UPI0014515ACA|nr:pilus (MSHA type) biogenesis protein MshL [Campylobacter sp. RM16192]QCD52700.1 transformation system, type II secretion system secretin protein CtsD [Campylobacter sp. RM16192]
MLISKLNKVITIILFCTHITYAQDDCNTRVFNLKINEQVSIHEVLTQLSDMCNFSVITKDEFASKAIKEEISGINIKDMTISEIFNILLYEKNLHHTFDKKILRISALQTKTFKIDYITSIREGAAITKASVDSAPIEVGSEKNDDDDTSDITKGGGKLDNVIRSVEKFNFWENLDSEIKAILNNTTENIIAPDPIINANAGLITITGTVAQINRVSEYIKDLQKRLKKQVVIDVSIISVDLSNGYTKGVDWSKFNIGFKTGLFDRFIPVGLEETIEKNSEGNPITIKKYTYGTTTANTIHWSNRNIDQGNLGGLSQKLNISTGFTFNLDGVINFLEVNGKTKIVSNPKIATLNNQQALISVGDNINYRVQEESTNNNTLNGKTTVTYKQYSVFIGILLNLLPEVSDDNKIMLRINPSLSSFKYNEDDTRQSTAIREIAPDTIQKKLSTVVQVNSGDTIVLGGLIAQTKGKENTKVPFLGDIPIVGNAFKSTKDQLRTTELVFIITPRIIDISSHTPIKQTLKDLGFSRSTYE